MSYRFYTLCFEEVKTETNGQSATVTKSGDENPAKQNLSAEELEPKIVRQIEHYFGDYNLPRDKFLKETIKADDGWVPMETMLNFQRLAALSTDAKVHRRGTPVIFNWGLMR